MKSAPCQRRHSAHESRLEQAVVLADREEALHSEDYAWPHGLSDALADILDRTVAHQQREQSMIFSMLMSGVGSLPARLIDDMVAAHEDLLRRWRRLDRRTEAFTPPSHACQTWKELYLLCRDLHLDCRRQVNSENMMLLAVRDATAHQVPDATASRAQCR